MLATPPTSPGTHRGGAGRGLSGRARRGRTPPRRPERPPRRDQGTEAVPPEGGLGGGLLCLARNPDDGEAGGLLCHALRRLDRTPVADPVLNPVVAGLRSLLRDGRLAQVTAMGTLHDACGLDPRTADALLTAAAPRDEIVALADHLAPGAEHAPS